MYWYNGKLIDSEVLELSINDPGLLYGATVFTTLRVYNECLDNPLSNWSSHCHRLLTSLEFLRWDFPNWSHIRQGAEIIKTRYKILRITIFPDGREWIMGRDLPEGLKQRQEDGIKAIVSDEKLVRSLPSHKTGNYLTPWLGKNIAQLNQCQEAILVNKEGNWLETATGNLWGWGNDSWWTPPIEEGILPGVMRNLILKRLEALQYLVKEEPWTPNLVKDFQAIAYSNSVVEIVPIHSVLKQEELLKYNPYHQKVRQLRGIFSSIMVHNSDIP
jgi:4-amino-4-deoxychorismate lyase